MSVRVRVMALCVVLLLSSILFPSIGITLSPGHIQSNHTAILENGAGNRQSKTSASISTPSSNVPNGSVVNPTAEPVVVTFKTSISAQSEAVLGVTTGQRSLITPAAPPKNSFNYNVTFNETGLTSGVSWSVTLNSVNLSSTTSTITFSESNNTYPFSVGNVTGYSSSPSTGNVTVNGANVSLNITFTPVYPVTFNETKLPSGARWFVNLTNGQSFNSTSSTITFSEPNGIYTYIIATTNKAYSANGSTFNVSGGSPPTVSVTFTLVTYPVTFTENGLPSGTTWYVNITGKPSSSSTSQTITTNLSNGSYSYSIGTSNTKYSSPGGTVTVSGPVSQPVTFTLVTYPVTFTETGLLSGTTWSVTLNGTTLTSTAPSDLIFSGEPNGTYSYSVSSADKNYSASGGTVTVSGPVSQPVTFTLVTYPVTFTETKLPSGTRWFVNLSNGNSANSTSSTITFSEPNGTYSFSVSSADSNYSANGGTFTVNGAPVSVSVTFSLHTYTVTFTENNLLPGTSWSVTLNGVNQTSTSTTITFSEPNGTYTFTIGSVNGYYATPSSGSFNLNGAAVTKTITFTPIEFKVTISETGLPLGTRWFVNLSNGNSANSTSSTITFSEPNGTYSFSVSSADSNYSANGGTFTVNGAPVSVSVTFSLHTYTVTFTENNLLPGTSWSVTLNGVNQTSTSTTITFSEKNGTYTFNVSVTVSGVVAAYRVSPSSGQLNVTGTKVTQSITFTREYLITINESGLPSSTLWSVTLNGMNQTSTNSTITYTVPDGTYTFTVNPVSGYVPNPSGNSFNLNGANVTKNVTFTPYKFRVTFSETGLPVSGKWFVNLTDGQSFNSVISTITFNEPNGTYTYIISAANRSFSANGGTFTVNNSTIQVSVTFSLVTYTVTFKETGLLSGKNWSVTLNGIKNTSNTSIITFIGLTNGTYNFIVLPSSAGVAYYTTSPATGVVTILGANDSQQVSFTPFFTVYFNETGLSLNGNNSWSLTLNGVNHTSTTPTITFSETNGLYNYIVGNVPQYYSSPNIGQISILGSNNSTSVTFKHQRYTVTFTESGLPTNTNWSVQVSGQHLLSSTSTSEKILLINGTYTFTISTVDKTYYAHGGSFTINGSSISILVSFTVVTFVIKFIESGLPTGKSWSVTFNGTATYSNVSIISFYVSNGTYSYFLTEQGYAPSPASGTIIVLGRNVTQTITFKEVKYSISISETGLPTGKTWYVNLSSGQSLSSVASTIFLQMPNGSYSFTIGIVPGYVATPASGAIYVNGSAASVVVVFKMSSYSVTFTETGLPSGSTWLVTFNGVATLSSSSSISFSVPNGTYDFSIGTESGYQSTLVSGTVTVNGSAVTQPVAFTGTHHVSSATTLLFYGALGGISLLVFVFVAWMLGVRIKRKQ